MNSTTDDTGTTLDGQEMSLFLYRFTGTTIGDRSFDKTTGYLICGLDPAQAADTMADLYGENSWTTQLHGYREIVAHKDPFTLTARITFAEDLHRECAGGVDVFGPREGA